MFFDSTAYVVFLSFVTLLYWRLPFRKQNYLLLAASYFFYGWWDWRFLLLMIGSTIVDFFIARKIEQSENPRQRKALLVISFHQPIPTPDRGADSAPQPFAAAGSETASVRGLKILWWFASDSLGPV